MDPRHAGLAAQRHGFAPRAHALPPRPLPLRAVDQGPFDWLVPFIPPFLRVNRDTREQIWRSIAHAASPDALRGLAERLSAILREHGAQIAKYAAWAALWGAGLVWVHANIHEFATSYVILSGFVALCMHLYSGETTAATDANGETISAYSVFNKGAKRMMGSISAEQFENEIRHRGPQDVGRLDDDDDAPLHHDNAFGEEEEDPDLLEALRQSLEEKKREERRARRTQRRR